MIEHVICPFHDVDTKFDAAGGVEVMRFSGYGAVFGNLDAHGDVIAPGAFADTLSESLKSGIWPAMLSQHGALGLTTEDLTPVGVWAELAEDGKGLKVDGILANTERGRDLHTLMKMKPRPAINGLSIGYIAKEWTPRTKPDEPRRTLKKVKLIEISPVTFPANNRARVQAVKAIEGLQKLSDCEDYLRESGYSKSQALAFIARVKSCLGRSDSDGGEKAELVDACKRALAVFQP